MPAPDDYDAALAPPTSPTRSNQRWRCIIQIASLLAAVQCSPPPTLARQSVSGGQKPVHRPLADLSPSLAPWLAPIPGLDDHQRVLAPPPDRDVLVSRAQQFLTAIGTGKVERLSPHVTSHAVVVDSRGVEASLSEYWERRFKQRNYRATAGEMLVLVADIRVVPLTDSPAQKAIARLKPRERDQLVHVPFLRTTFEGEVLFPGEWWLLMRPISGEWRIVACLDDLSPNP